MSKIKLMRYASNTFFVSAIGFTIVFAMTLGISIWEVNTLVEKICATSALLVGLSLFLSAFFSRLMRVFGGDSW